MSTDGSKRTINSSQKLQKPKRIKRNDTQQQQNTWPPDQSQSFVQESVRQESRSAPQPPLLYSGDYLQDFTDRSAVPLIEPQQESAFNINFQESFHVPLHGITEYPQMHLLQQRVSKNRNSKRYAVVIFTKVRFLDCYHLIGCCSICSPQFHRYVNTNFSKERPSQTFKQIVKSCSHIEYIVGWWYGQVF